jgi:hypothetical protein
MRNIEVIKAWAEGRKASSGTGNLWTDGKILWSYSLAIGERTVRPHHTLVAVVDHTLSGGSFYSVTTSRHVNAAKRFADIVIPHYEVSLDG